jgi:hypothetical protein
MTWLYEHGLDEFDESHIGDNVGFVYMIENLDTGRRYIGRKYFSKAGYRQVKGKRKKIRKPSDWETYYGSNETLKAEVKELGADRFERTILHLCKSKSECSYWETYEIFSRHALLSDNYYNAWVSCRIRKDHLKKT